MSVDMFMRAIATHVSVARSLSTCHRRAVRAMRAI